MIIQSYWSLPSQAKINNKFSRNNGGWINEKYHAMSWALSCLKWKEIYGEITLYTDEIGKKWLIDELELPYDKVVICLDKLNNHNSLLWALPKLYVYSLQEKPFLHVDSDVYIWEKLKFDYLETPLFCQNIERNFPYYRGILDEINNKFNFIPEELKNLSRENFTSINAGVIGGSDTDFYKKLAKEAFRFVDKNQDNLLDVNTGLLNVVFEQLFFYLLANHDNIVIEPLFDNVSSQFSELIQFNLSPFYSKYIHLIGIAKKNLTSCHQLEARLLYEFPKIHGKISKIYQAKEDPLYETNTLSKKESENEISKKLNLDVVKIINIIGKIKKTKEPPFDLSILYNNAMNDILKLKLKLNSNCTITTLQHQFPSTFNFKDINANDNKNIPIIEPTKVIFFKTYADEIMFEPLKKWNALLLYFEGTSLSINELINKIRPTWSLQYTGNNFDFDILNFVMINLVYKNILTITD